MPSPAELLNLQEAARHSLASVTPLLDTCPRDAVRHLHAFQLCQWALESGWGIHTPLNSNNPFGVKALPGEPYVIAKTTEVIGGTSVSVDQFFRVYDTLLDAFVDHVRLLTQVSFYKDAWQTLVSQTLATGEDAKVTPIAFMDYSLNVAKHYSTTSASKYTYSILVLYNSSAMRPVITLV